MLGTELRSSVRIANALNLGVISPASWFVGSLLFFVFETSLAISGWPGTQTPAFFFFSNCLLDYKYASKHMAPLPFFCLFLTESGVML